MQGQRGIIGSLPEILEFDHGSTSGNAIIDQQICWNIMQNPADTRLADFLLSPSHINNAHINSIDQERQNLTGWSLGEPSSSGAPNEASREEQKSEHAWSASTSACAVAGPRLEERGYEPTNILSLDSVNVNSQFVQSSNSNAIPQNLNLNAGYVGHGGDNCQLLESSKSGRAENDRTPTASGSDAFLHPPGSGGFMMEENDGRPGSSLDGRRQSCKRKAVEGHIGQSSMSESPGFFQCSENSAWSGVPARYDAGSSLSISAPLEQVNPRLGLGLRGLASDSIPDSALAGRPEASQRNFRLRMNPSNQDSIPPPLFSTGHAVRRSNIASSHHSSRLLPTEHSLDFRSLPIVDAATSQGQPVPVPALPQNVQSFRWNESSSSRNANSSGSVNLGNREEGNSRGVTRNLWEHPMFVPTTELRSSVRNPTSRSTAGGHTSVPGSIASASRTGPSSGVHPLSAPTWVSHPNPPSRNSRRLAEYVRRSLFSSANADSAGQSSTHLLHSGAPGSSEDVMISPGVPNQGHHRSYPRSASWMERQGDGGLGFPYPLRTLAAGEGRSRLLVSEIRSVLDLMRRGEGLRFEDVMVLDHSVFLGLPDVNDRHREMRLDVDNMSYEELLALEERIGNVSTGLSEEIISKQLKMRKYAAVQRTEVETEPCCVCQEEYKNGDDIGTLDCGHDYHTVCIKQWLMLKNWCPICKTTGLAT
ncbi:probable E3 ubiquitin-protein ligase RHG1A isoform X2 [Euphorbia lathyris]|uniref:probable E3 ubiquitin-protein ligase RHG1A isoform X2 n=1 Tax=Euphorbia lathyris TaxID=212925 RepID=UPI0033137800